MSAVGGVKSNTLAFFVVGTIDIYEYIASDKEGKVLTDLLVELGVDFVIVMASGFVGFLAGVGVILLFASAPVWAVVGAGIVAGVVAGVLLDEVEETFEIKKTLKSKMRQYKEKLEANPDFDWLTNTVEWSFWMGGEIDWDKKIAESKKSRASAEERRKQLNSFFGLTE